MTYSQRKYRTEYLKSRQWQAVRSERMKLIRGNGRVTPCECCRVPFEGRWRNGHHVTYPADWYETTVEQIRMVCPECHDFIHGLIDAGNVPQDGDPRELWTLTLSFCGKQIETRQKWWRKILDRREAKKAKKLKEAEQTKHRRRKTKELIKESRIKLL